MGGLFIIISFYPNFYLNVYILCYIQFSIFLKRIEVLFFIPFLLYLKIKYQEHTKKYCYIYKCNNYVLIIFRLLTTVSKKIKTNKIMKDLDEEEELKKTLLFDFLEGEIIKLENYLKCRSQSDRVI